jgi:hypothetical protein
VAAARRRCGLLVFGNDEIQKDLIVFSLCFWTFL